VRIGLDATCLPSALAGVGRYIHGVVRGLASIDHRNEYFIFAKQHDAAQFGPLPANMQLVLLPNFSRPLRLAWQHFLAAQHAHRLRLDLWHGMHYTLPAFARPTATVATIHDLGMIRFPQLYPWHKRIYFRQAIAQTLHAARHIVAVSESTGRDINAWRAQHHHHIPTPPPVAAIPSGVEEKFFTAVPATEQARVRQAYGLEAPYLLFVGTFEKRKNLTTLLRAFGEMQERSRGQYLLALAGQPDNGSAEVHALVAHLQLQGCVRLLGYVPEADLPGLYQGASLFALPSHHEGFGFPLLEAMAGGVVALAADNSSLRELAAHPMLLCEETPSVWALRMEQLLADQTLRKEMSAYERERARLFSWRATAERLREIYESHASRPASGLQHKNDPNKHANSNQHFAAPHALLSAVRRTLAYADLFDYPLTLAELHEGLFEVAATAVAVRQALMHLQYNGEVEDKGGYYFLRGRASVVAQRQTRQGWSQELLQKHRTWLRLVQGFPFVRGVAISGALAFQNCKRDDDIDLFIIVESGRLWTVYASLALLLKWCGKRRRLCLNCLVDTAHLRYEDENLFVAHQIEFLRPVSGAEYFRQFFHANDWYRQFLPQSDAVARLASAKQNPDGLRAAKPGTLEKLFAGRLLDRLENYVCERYRQRIARLTQHLQPAGVVAARGQIRLFTHDHRFELQHKLAARLQELERQTAACEAQRQPLLAEA